MTAGNFNQDNSTVELVAVVSYNDDKTSLYLWVLGMNESNFDVIAFHTVAADIYGDHATFDSVVVHLTDSVNESSALAVAYHNDSNLQVETDYQNLTIRSYQIKGLRGYNNYT